MNKYKSITGVLCLSLFAVSVFADSSNSQAQKIIASLQAQEFVNVEGVTLQIKQADINRDNNRLSANDTFLRDPKNKPRAIQHDDHTDIQYDSKEIAERAIEAQNFVPIAGIIRPSKLSSGGKSFMLSYATTQITVPKSRNGG